MLPMADPKENLSALNRSTWVNTFFCGLGASYVTVSSSRYTESIIVLSDVDASMSPFIYPRFPGTLTLFIASVGIDYIITMRIYAKA